MTSIARASHGDRTPGFGFVAAASFNQFADREVAVHRCDVEFPADDGMTLRAWLYLPAEGGDQLPAITMANGFASTRWHGVDRFARFFAAAGFAVLLHDHRNFGTSDGAERGDVDPWRQVSDWRSAISYLCSRPEVAEDRVGVWGTGYAGGHAMVLGATDRRLSAVVAQMPTMNGLPQNPGENQGSYWLNRLFDEDCRERLDGGRGLSMAVASSDPSQPASFRSPDAFAFYNQQTASGVWKNEVSVRSLRASLTYVPGAWLTRVAPKPLMLIADPGELETLSTYEYKGRARSPESLEFVGLRGGPFSPFEASFEEASAAALRWFAKHLREA